MPVLNRWGVYCLLVVSLQVLCLQVLQVLVLSKVGWEVGR